MIDDIVKYEMWSQPISGGDYSPESVWTIDDYDIAKSAVDHMNKLNVSDPDERYSDKVYFVMEIRTIRTPVD